MSQFACSQLATKTTKTTISATAPAASIDLLALFEMAQREPSTYTELKAAIAAVPATSDEIVKLKGAAELTINDMLDTNAPPDVRQLLVTLLREKLTKLQPAPTAQSAKSTDNLVWLAHKLPTWVQQDADEKMRQFAHYCASCAVVDQRVLDVQLHGCKDPIVKELIQSIFKQSKSILELLLECGDASIVKTELTKLLGNSNDAADFFQKFHVECPDINNEMWHSVLGFWHSLVLVRSKKDTELCIASQLHLSVGAGGALMAPLIFRKGTFMNQVTFTSSELADLVAFYSNDTTVNDVLAAFGVAVNVARDCGDEQSAIEKPRRPHILVRRDDCFSSDGRIVLVGEFKQHGAANAMVEEDKRRLVCLLRTLTDLRCQRAKTPASAAPAVASDMNSGASTSAKSSRSPKHVSAVAAPSPPAAAEPTVVAAQTDEAARILAAATNCRIGGFGLQVVGAEVTVTLLVQVHNSFYVNLTLLKTNVAECSLSDAIEYLALMIAISATDSRLDGDIATRLLSAAQWEKLNLTLDKKSNTKPAPSPSHPPAAPQAGQQRQPGTDHQHTAHDVALGSVVVDHDDRTVVRSAGGELAYKVMNVAKRARSDAVHEMRVHALLSRRAPAHVVPLLSHFEALVALPRHSVYYDTIVLVTPWCEAVKAAELRDVRDVALCGDGLLSALAALHRLGVLHGDVKWSNTLLMKPPLRLVLTDFGLAQQLDVDGGATLMRGLGTDGYMAPEVRYGRAPSVTAAADLFSAGVSLSELPAHEACEPLRALVRHLCTETACARPSAVEALAVWRRTVVPALEQLVIVEAKSPQPQLMASKTMASQTATSAPQVEAVAPPKQMAPPELLPVGTASNKAKKKRRKSHKPKQFGRNLTNTTHLIDGRTKK